MCNACSFSLQKIPPEKEKAYLGEVRTVIVSGLYAGTTDEVVEMFFENEKHHI